MSRAGPMTRAVRSKGRLWAAAAGDGETGGQAGGRAEESSMVVGAKEPSTSGRYAWRDDEPLRCNTSRGRVFLARFAAAVVVAARRRPSGLDRDLERVRSRPTQRRAR